jgi:GntR family transcriptional regulator, transcriptional repressor for pyruvate dehydrogenase complex
MPLQTIEPRRLYRQIADQLRLLIERGEFEVGSRLPPERDLALQLGVSRPSVREALIALEVECLVEVRMGSGVYVRSASAVANGGRVVAEAPLETIRARELIESELAAQAARHMKPALVRGLREAIAMMEKEAAAGQVPVRGDRLFHLRIAEAADNSVLLRVVTGLFDERHSNPLYEQLGSHFENARSWAAAVAEHRAVVDAIAKRSADAAREAMRRHLANSHDRFTAGWPAVPDAAPTKSPARAGARARRTAP